MNPLCRITPRHTLPAVLLWLTCLLPLHANAQTTDSAPEETPSTAAAEAQQPTFEQLV